MVDITAPSGFLLERDYMPNERAGVAALGVTGLISLFAVLYLFIFRRLDRKKAPNTHLFGYFICLLFANVLQAIGTAMNLRWVHQDKIIVGPFCTIQGAMIQAGNVGNAMWTFAIAVYLFELIFLRITSNRRVFIGATVFGWTLILIWILVGEYAIQTKERGPYFGVSGYWCWITKEYHNEQLFLQYFWCFISAAISFILYTTIFLRVRGNLAKVGSSWTLQFGEKWQLGLHRDYIDGSMMKLVNGMIWYPIAYTIVLIPLAILRFYEFAGKSVPFWATITFAIFYNLIGFINSSLLLITQRLFPDTTTLPEFNVPRQRLSMSLSKSGGVVPFTLERSETADKYLTERAASRAGSVSRAGSLSIDRDREGGDAGSRSEGQPSPCAPSFVSTTSVGPLLNRDRDPEKQ